MNLSRAFSRYVVLPTDPGPRRAFALTLAFNCAFVLWLLLRPGSHALVVGLDNVAQFAGPLLILPFCFAGKTGSSSSPPGIHADRRYLVPVLLALSAGCFALGQIIYTVYEQMLHYTSTPLPSWADPAFLSAYPCLLLAIFFVPRRPLSRAARVRIGFDSLMVILAVGTASWYFILGPTILQGADSTLGALVGSAYPLMDLVLISCLLLLSAHAHDVRLSGMVRTIGIALAIIVISDVIYDYKSLHQTYSTGAILPDVGWSLGYMLIGLAALQARAANAIMPETRDGDRSLDAPLPLWLGLLPYALMPLVGALLIYVHQTPGDPTLSAGVYLGSTILVGVLLGRQVLALLENRRLYDSLHQAYGQVEANNRALATANERLRNLAITDPLTNVPNHRALIAALDHELERARRYGRPCAIMFLDLDHFKALNDGYGHHGGDVVLREFAAVARDSLRGIDTLGRWGGEEFLAILPETDHETAQAAAEHVRMAVATHLFTVGGGTHLTCSIGTATYLQDGDDRHALIEAADRAMFAAKTLGRNQARAAHDPAVAALAGNDTRPNTREDLALAGTIEALAALVEVRETYSPSYALDVSTLCMQVATAWGLSAAESRMIGVAGRLSDIGKVAVPESVLRKQARLTKEEWALVRTHPVVGETVVSRVPALSSLAPLIRAHHERWDGTGYPDGLAGDEVPLGARIIAVAAAYRAIITSRPYKQARTSTWAIDELQRCAGTQFDLRVVVALKRVLDTPASAAEQQAS